MMGMVYCRGLIYQALSWDILYAGFDESNPYEPIDTLFLRVSLRLKFELPVFFNPRFKKK